MIQADRTIKFRIRICLFVFLFGFSFLGFRAFKLQFGPDDRIARIEEKQSDRRMVLSPQRGTIFDAQGKPLAVNLQMPSVFADPRMVENPARAAKLLAPVLQISARELLAKIKNKTKRFVWLARKTTPEVEKKIGDLDVAGIQVVHEAARIYPERELGAQVLGVVGMDGEGLEGLERYYDKFLRSEKLIVQTQKDARGRSIFSDDTLVVEPEPGADLYLTIDSVIQQSVEDELFAAAQKSRAKHAMGVVMDPQSGRVLAMATYPSMNPNRLDKINAESFRNRTLEDLLEPGSTFKVFSLSAALESGWLDPNQNFYCKKGSLKLNGKVIRTHEEHEWLTPKGIMKHSDNIGTSRIALKIGRDKMYEGIRKFGFGTETGIDFPGEPAGMLKKPTAWRDVDLANLSFGQGIGVSVVQLAVALSMVANGGFSVQPHLVTKAKFPDGRELTMERPKPRTQMISNRTLKLMKEWMEASTEPDGTGSLAQTANYRIAGKTGTAQKIDQALRGYSSTKVVSSFMGFAPASDPKLTAIFIFDEPEKADYGGQLAAPVFRKVMENALAYLGVPPDKLKSVEARMLPVLTAAIIQPAKSVLLDTNSVPDFRGLTVREVLSRAQKASMEVRVIGSGVAIRQSLNPGASRTNPQKLDVFFEPRSVLRGGET